MTFLINLIFLATFVPICIVFFNMRLKKKKSTFIFFFLGVILCTVVEKCITHLSLLLFPLSLLCITITLLFVFNVQIKTLLFAVLSSYFVIASLYQFIDFIGSQFSVKLSRQNRFNVLIQSIIVFVLICSITYIIRLKKKIGNRLSFFYVSFFSIVIAVDGTVVIVIGYLIFKSNINIIPAIVIYVLLILGILIQIILLIRMIKSRDQHKENEKLAKQYLENQTRYYEYLVQREEDTKKFRHDIRNHINMLNILFQENKIDECQKYLMDLTTHYENIHNAISVNNCIADAILNQYYYEAKLHDITLNVSGHFPPQCDLSAYDICTIFSNLLDNALKAVIDCNGKNISIGCRYTETEILLSIENDSNHVKLDSNGMPRTSQKDYSQHGFGLKNVQQCVIQNNGHITIQAENNQFKVMLSLGRGINNENCNNR